MRHGERERERKKKRKKRKKKKRKKGRKKEEEEEEKGRLNEETEVNESDQSGGMEKMNWNSSEIYMLLGKSCRSEMGKWGGQLLKGAVTRVSV